MTSGRMTPAQALELLKDLHEREVEGWFNHPNPWIRQWIDHPCLGRYELHCTSNVHLDSRWVDTCSLTWFPNPRSEVGGVNLLWAETSEGDDRYDPAVAMLFHIWTSMMFPYRRLS